MNTVSFGIRKTEGKGLKTENKNLRGEALNKYGERADRVRDYELCSKQASDALRALYTKKDKFVEYLEAGMDKGEIIKALKDDEKMGRSFFGTKRSIAKTITNAKDQNLAIKNFNILMNMDKTNRLGDRLAEILKIVTDDGENNFYNFKGGELTKKDALYIMKLITAMTSFDVGNTADMPASDRVNHLLSAESDFMKQDIDWFPEYND